ASLTAIAVALGIQGTHAATVNVITDPSLSYNGYENVYTNGLATTTWPAYVSQYLGGFGAPYTYPNDSTIDNSGTITIGADDWADVTSPYNLDPLIWGNNSGTSAAICDVISDIYAQNNAANAGDTVVFTGTLVTNTLAAPYGAN